MGNRLAQVPLMGLERSSRSKGMFGAARQLARVPPPEEGYMASGGLLAVPYLRVEETPWSKQTDLSPAHLFV